MKTVGQKLDAFRVTGVKPGVNCHEEKGRSAFETITEASSPGNWKIIHFYPKDLPFVCPTEIVEFGKLACISPGATRCGSAAAATTSSSSSPGDARARVSTVSATGSSVIRPARLLPC